MDANQMYDALADEHGVSEEALRIVSSINGHSTDTYESVLYVVTGYHTFEQIAEMGDE